MGAPAELSTKDLVARARPAGRAMVLPARRWLLLIALLDFALLAAAFIGALEIRFLSQPGWVDRQFPATAPYALMFAAVLSLCYVAMGLYQTHSREGPPPVSAGWRWRWPSTRCRKPMSVAACC